MPVLKPLHVSSSAAAQDLINVIAGMLHRGEIKIIRGSLNDTIMDMEFKLKGTTESWSLKGVMDAHGGLSLARSN